MATDARSEAAGLIVVGASVGGLAAAILAADRGQRVVVLEREREPGGSARGEPESIAAAGTRLQRAAGVADDAETLAADLLGAARHHLESELAHALARESGPLVDWLADRCGVAFDLARHVPTGHSVTRLHTPEQGGGGLVGALGRAAARQTRTSVRCGSTVESLVRDEQGTVTGVTARTGRRVVQVVSGPVLLACGGFAAADALVAEHCPDVADLPYLGWPGASGEALRLGAGAGLRRMGASQVTAFLSLPGQLAVTAPLVELGAILVNQGGRRFADETAESLALARAVRSQPGRVAYLLFDERIAAAARAVDPFFARVVLPRTARRGATLADLARQFELDFEHLERTLGTYNANIDLGGDPFGREVSGAPLAPPFHAIRVTGARRRTLGGLAVDGSARALDPAGRPIPGLYVAGGAAAGLGGEGTEGALAGSAALAALGLGRLAALHAAQAPTE
ncbi:MAG TPA: FAD-binding protein [Candidatus Binatia bacterium]|nr:FAD-binding protein [Candidatus Binatia bacterium]